MKKILIYNIFLILFLTFSYIVISSDKNITGKEGPVITNFSHEFLTNTSEEDSEVVYSYFSEGMNTDDMIDILKHEENIIKKKDNYKPVSYNFEKKLHYKDIENILLNMSTLDIVKLELLGITPDNRNIYGIEVGNGKDILYINANIHAGEVGSTLILIRFLSEILNNYYLNDKDTIEYLNNVKIAVIPSLNPDGYEIYNFGKQSINNQDLWIYKNYDSLNIDHLKSNANGVDLNRNFPSQNAGLYYKDKKLLKSVAFERQLSPGKYYCGDSLGSEPETKASMYFMLKHYKNIYAYIDMHSQGRVIYNGKPNLTHEFNEMCRNFAKFVSKHTKYKVHKLESEEVGQGNDGTATDFMAEIAHNFKFSTKTGRLSASTYIENNKPLMYNYPVITIETLTTYTRNVKLFKEEYYNKKIRDVLYNAFKRNY